MGFPNNYLLIVVSFPWVSGVIIPLPKLDGSPSLIVSHMTLMEHRMNSLQRHVQTTTSELTTVKQKLQTTTSELLTVQHKLQVAESKLESTAKKQRATEIEVASLKSELLIARREVNITTTDLHATRARVDSLTSQVEDANSNINQQIHDVQSGQTITEQDLEATKNSLQSTKTEVKELQKKVNTISHGLSQQISTIKRESGMMVPGPMTKANGNPDWENIIGHVTVMEHEVDSLRRQFQTTTSDLNITKEKLNTVTSQMTVVTTRLQAASQERITLLNNQQVLEFEQDVIQNETQAYETEIADLKSELLMNQILINMTMTDLQSTRAKVDSLTSQVEDANRRLNQEIYDVQSKQIITEHNLAATKSSLQSTDADVKAVQNQVNLISGTVISLTQQVSTIRRKSDAGPAFQVSMSQSYQVDETTLKFDTVDYNTGGGYNQTSGMFKAPVSGTYIFWANVLMYKPVGNHYVSINKGQETLTNGYYRIDNVNDPGVASAMTVTHLDKGAQVHFSVSVKEYIASHYSSYGGAMLHAV